MLLLRTKLYLPVLLLIIFSAQIYGQDVQPPDPPAGFDKIEQMIPMRDGVKLHTIIYKPKSHREPLPILSSERLTASTALIEPFPAAF